MNKLFYSPKPAIVVLWIRLLVFGFLAYNLLSRDFSVFGLTPNSILELYPSAKTSNTGIFLLGVPALMDLTTFHWVHWVLPMPSMETLKGIQFSAVLMCFLVMIFGRGKYNILAILCYALMAYLFGFIWRTGTTNEGITIQLQVALVYCFMQFKEYPVWNLKKEDLLKYKSEYGAFFSIVLLIITIYYFSSGVKKYIDIPLTSWFKYDLYQVQQYLKSQADVGYLLVEPLYDFIIFSPIVNYIAIPLVYIEHTLTPIMYFKRKYITQFWIFYTIFHLMSLTSEILFIGLLVSWFVFLPVERFIEPILIKHKKGDKYYELLKKLNWLKTIQFKEHTSNSVSVENLISGDKYRNFTAIRRILWAFPIGWLFILPVYVIYYLPVLHFVIAATEKKINKA